MRNISNMRDHSEIQDFIQAGRGPRPPNFGFQHSPTGLGRSPLPHPTPPVRRLAPDAYCRAELACVSYYLTSFRGRLSTATDSTGKQNSAPTLHACLLASASFAMAGGG
jgi:hypothetical protein